jgi:hypothetical protein
VKGQDVMKALLYDFLISYPIGIEY